MITVKELIDKIKMLLKKKYIKENDIVCFGSSIESFGRIGVCLPKVQLDKKTLNNSGTLMFSDQADVRRALYEQS